MDYDRVKQYTILYSEINKCDMFICIWIYRFHIVLCRRGASARGRVSNYQSRHRWPPPFFPSVKATTQAAAAHDERARAHHHAHTHKYYIRSRWYTTIPRARAHVCVIYLLFINDKFSSNKWGKNIYIYNLPKYIYIITRILLLLFANNNNNNHRPSYIITLFAVRTVTKIKLPPSTTVGDAYLIENNGGRLPRYNAGVVDEKLYGTRGTKKLFHECIFFRFLSSPYSARALVPAPFLLRRGENTHTQCRRHV